MSVPTKISAKLRKPYVRRSAFIAIALAGLVVLLLTYGVWPGMVTNMPAHLVFSGIVECLADQGLVAPWVYADCVGYPIGFPLIQGLPFVYEAYILVKFTTLTPATAVVLSSASFLALGFMGAILFFKKIGANWSVALFFGFLALWSYGLVGHSLFGATMYGLILLPFYAWIDLVLIERIGLLQNAKKGSNILLAVLYFVIRAAALFLDGYSFVMSGLIGGVLLGSHLIKNRKKIWAAIPLVLVFLGANILAYILYDWYVPGGAEYSTETIDYFRGQGADVISFFLPPNLLWLPSALNIYKDWSGRAFHGYGANVTYNYFGYALLIAALAYSFTKVRLIRYRAAFVVVGLVGLLLSLGPSLKVNDQHIEAITDPKKMSYSMPADEATFDLHTSFIFEHVPGIKNMRLTYRWVFVVRLALLVAACGTLMMVLSKKKWILAATLVLLILSESLPNYSKYQSTYRNYYGQEKKLYADLIDQFPQYVREGEKVYFQARFHQNDFLAINIAARTGAKSFNTGGDKNSAFAIQEWPESLQRAYGGQEIKNNVLEALRDSLVDVVVLPYFNMQLSGYYWPQDERGREVEKNRFLEKLGEWPQDVEFTDTKWFATLRKR